MTRPHLYRYSVAAVAVAVATYAAMLTAQVGMRDAMRYLPFLIAAITAAWYGGIGPALLATVGGAIVPQYDLSAPYHLARIHGRENWISLFSYAAAALLTAAFLELYRREVRGLADQVEVRQKAEETLRFSLSHVRFAKELAERSEQRAVAERDDLRQRLETSAERMNIAEESAGFRLFDWDFPDGPMFLAGDARGIFGTSEWEGQASLLAAAHPEDRGHLDWQIARCIAERSALDLEFRVLWPDGSVHWVAAKGRAAYNDKGVPTRVIGIFQDITKNKATEAALVRNEKLATAGRLAASIAHEINNPLFAVTNLLFIIQDDATLSGAGREYLSLAQQELARAAHIAQQALGFYKETAEPVKVNIAELMDEVLLLYARNMPANIKLQTHCDAGCETYAIRGEMRQVLSNLISNAIQALGSGGILSVEVQQQEHAGERGIAVRVIDDGPGIPPEHRTRIFEPFFTTKKDVGTGLGLWLAKQIVQKHGGSIEMQSNTDAQKHGTTFFVFLPERVRKSTKHAAA